MATKRPPRCVGDLSLKELEELVKDRTVYLQCLKENFARIQANTKYLVQDDGLRRSWMNKKSMYTDEIEVTETLLEVAKEIISRKKIQNTKGVLTPEPDTSENHKNDEK